MFKNQELLSILALAAIAVAGLGVPVAQAGDISGVTNLLAANHYDEADLRQLEMFNADTGQWMFTFDPLPGGLQASMGTKATEFHDGYWYTFTTVDEPNRIAAVYRYDIDGTNPTLVAENVTGMIEGFAADDNHLYVGTKGGWGWTGGLYKFDMSTTPYTPLGQINAGNFAGMDFGPDGNLYSGNEGTGKVSIHDTDGNGLGQFDLTRAYRPEFHPDGDLYVTSYSDNPVVSHFNSPLHADPLLRAFGDRAVKPARC